MHEEQESTETEAEFGTVDDLRATLTRNGLDGFLPALDALLAERDGLVEQVRGAHIIARDAEAERDRAVQTATDWYLEYCKMEADRNRLQDELHETLAIEEEIRRG